MTLSIYERRRQSEMPRLSISFIAFCLLFSASIAAGEDNAPIGSKIGYVLTDETWAVYQTVDGKAECPQGLNNWGPLEELKALYPDDGKKRTLADTVLKRQAAAWFPDGAAKQSPYREAQGPIALGLNLDGKIGPSDFTSPDGEKGIDNQLYRVIGCIEDYRWPTGKFTNQVSRFIRDFNYNRVLIELTNLHSLMNDDAVEVTVYRGRDRLMVDAAGNDIIPGGSQRIDERWGGKYIQHLYGKIVDGVLTTEPADIVLPHAIYDVMGGEDTLLNARFRLKLTSERAEGLLAGYSDIDKWYRQFMHSWYGHIYYPDQYRELNKFADGYPDPKTGANTAISSALQLKFAKVFIQHADATSPNIAEK